MTPSNTPDWAAFAAKLDELQSKDPQAYALVLEGIQSRIDKMNEIVGNK